MSQNTAAAATYVFRLVAAPTVGERVSQAITRGAAAFGFSTRLGRKLWQGGTPVGLETAERVLADGRAQLLAKIARNEVQLRALEMEQKRLRCALAQMGEQLWQATCEPDPPAAGADAVSPLASSSTASPALPPPARASSPGSRAGRTGPRNGSQNAPAASRADHRTGSTGTW